MVNDLNVAVSQLVAASVERALEPYRDVFNKMAQLMGVGEPTPAVVKRGPGRPPASSKAPQKPGRRIIPKGAVKVASNFHVGQKVSYKQGKGSFGATVIEIDTEGMLRLRREADGKEVERPALKVYKA